MFERKDSLKTISHSFRTHRNIFFNKIWKHYFENITRTLLIMSIIHRKRTAEDFQTQGTQTETWLGIF